MSDSSTCGKNSNDRLSALLSHLRERANAARLEDEARGTNVLLGYRPTGSEVYDARFSFIGSASPDVVLTLVEIIERQRVALENQAKLFPNHTVASVTKALEEYRNAVASTGTKSEKRDETAVSMSGFREGSGWHNLTKADLQMTLGKNRNFK